MKKTLAWSIVVLLLLSQFITSCTARWSQEVEDMLQNVYDAEELNSYFYTTDTDTNGSDKEVLVLEVIDWDTFSYVDNGETIKVRMLWIDAPESNTLRFWHAEKHWDESKKYLKYLIESKVVTIQSDLTQDDTDTYWRQLRYVFLNNININNMIISEWYAKEYTFKKKYYKFQKLFKASQKEDKKNKLNI